MIRLFRVILPVSDIARAKQFYAALLDMPGAPVSNGRHYFGCGGTILACFDPRADGDPWDATPNPDHVYFAVDDLEASLERARKAGAKILRPIETQPWGERGNKLCFVANGHAVHGGVDLDLVWRWGASGRVGGAADFRAIASHEAVAEEARAAAHFARSPMRICWPADLPRMPANLGARANVPTLRRSTFQLKRSRWNVTRRQTQKAVASRPIAAAVSRPIACGSEPAQPASLLMRRSLLDAVARAQTQIGARRADAPLAKPSLTLSAQYYCCATHPAAQSPATPHPPHAARVHAQYPQAK